MALAVIGVGLIAAASGARRRRRGHAPVPQNLQVALGALDELADDGEPKFDLIGQPLVDKQCFLSSIALCLNDPVSGVYVVWAPPGAGKTSYVLKAVRKWRSDAPTAGVHHFKYVDTYTRKTPANLLQDLGVTSEAELGRELLQFSGHQLCIVLDNFDSAFYGGDVALRNFIVNLATVATRTKSFRVIVVLQAADKAAEVLNWNCNVKIHLCGELDHYDTRDILKFKWEKAEVLSFLRDVDWLDEDKRTVVDAACKSGCVTTLFRLKNNKDDLQRPDMQKKIDEDELAWRNGVDALASRFRVS